ncbi:hypothetical protein V2J09_005114 [Rumex salicifolius]
MNNCVLFLHYSFVFLIQIIKNADVEDLRELGSGTYGTVFHGKWRGTDIAIKRIKKSCFSGSSLEQERLLFQMVTLDLRKKLLIALDAAIGMEYLHSRNIVDVFSFGIALWEILTGDEPYANMHCGAIIDWKKLMEQCWASDPTTRPTFTQVAAKLRSMYTALPSKGHRNQVRKKNLYFLNS